MRYEVTLIPEEMVALDTRDFGEPTIEDGHLVFRKAGTLLVAFAPTAWASISPEPT